MRLTWDQRLELWIFGNVAILVSNETMRRRTRAVIHAHTRGYRVQLPEMPEHERQVRMQLCQDVEWRSHTADILASQKRWRWRLGFTAP